ncbi:hypothetical protein JMM81_01715 [Bacillus sp. V3B]|uniref:hypothetical protein n=1 Tax=Bacillus sp. V3B TaxID=2804915 RepID=UPI00210BA2B1|nr:hypothetical protein [Bacillus sp. V3B]MCQ6273693.1 hypothetical protein [Bacillus sp. V3B]
MGTILISLFIFSILLFLTSFFLKDPYKEIREEIDQLSMQQLQELYQIKKKLKVLEEELLINDIELSPPLSQMGSSDKKIVHDIIKNQVWSLAQQGTPIEQIAKLSSLPVQDVQGILMEFSFRGEKYE